MTTEIPSVDLYNNRFAAEEATFQVLRDIYWPDPETVEKVMIAPNRWVPKVFACIEPQANVKRCPIEPGYSKKYINKDFLDMFGDPVTYMEKGDRFTVAYDPHAYFSFLPNVNVFWMNVRTFAFADASYDRRIATKPGCTVSNHTCYAHVILLGNGQTWVIWKSGPTYGGEYDDVLPNEHKLFLERQTWWAKFVCYHEKMDRSLHPDISVNESYDHITDCFYFEPEWLYCPIGGGRRAENVCECTQPRNSYEGCSWKNVLSIPDCTARFKKQQVCGRAMRHCYFTRVTHSHELLPLGTYYWDFDPVVHAEEYEEAYLRNFYAKKFIIEPRPCITPHFSLVTDEEILSEEEETKPDVPLQEVNVESYELTDQNKRKPTKWEKEVHELLNFNVNFYYRSNKGTVGGR